MTFCNWIAENKSKAQICSFLKCKPETLTRYLNILNIDYKGNKSGKGTHKKRAKTSVEEYLNTSIDVQTNKIRKKLLEEKNKRT